jgi:predicted O-methyltransferase YrrM
VLPRIAAEELAPFDFVFIDADKPSNAAYVEWALKLSRAGSVIVVDNVGRAGAVVDPNSTDASVQGVRRLMDMLANEPRLDATAFQTVGLKGYDGLLIAQVTSG